MNIKKVLTFSAGPLVAAFIGFVTTPILSWLYSSEDIGLYSLSISLISFTIIIFSVGMDSAYIREFHDVDSKDKLFSTCLIPTFLLLLALTAFVFFYFKENISILGFSSYEIHLLLFCSFLATANRFLSLDLRMKEEALLYSAYLIINKFAVVAFLVGFYFFRDGNRASIFNSLLLSQILLLLYLLFFSKIKLTTTDLKFLDIKKYLRYGLPLVVSSTSYWAMMSSDKFIISYYLDVSAVGFYSVAQTLGAVFIIFQSILSIIWPPYIYKMDKLSTEIAIKKGYLWIDIMLTGSIVLCVLFLLSINFILGLFPSKYASVIDFLSFILLSSVVFTLSELVLIGMNVKKKTPVVMLITFVALIINISLSILLVDLFSLSGVAIATLISFTVMFFLRLWGSAIFWGSERVLSILSKMVLLYMIVLLWKFTPILIPLILMSLLLIFEFKKIKGFFSDEK
ncbi:lipopolysaccharide biosynthesis protein [Pseudoalteromonas sp. NSLLW218]|uniref:lipopolysaccharide biosynthesis protein n=1 Tax=Pseudoalteromonas sp. NSLLW218 TaxID=2792048 RepID=UPI0018CD7D69|nr:oligosaccharide flippase family protein [Pseudoalteromonas sp. NSLLW218]MBH0087498.1 oligosaccharide flippase family protein [Pseudoalteromonas sp. NSLLW218]